MRPIPKLDDVDAMAARGRRSALMSCRSEACEELRDVAVSIQSCDIFNDDISGLVQRGRAALDRLLELHKLAA